MPKSTVYTRPPLHQNIDSATPLLEQSEKEDKFTLNSSNGQISTETDSDFEGFEDNNTYPNYKPEIRKASPDFETSLQKNVEKGGCFKFIAVLVVLVSLAGYKFINVWPTNKSIKECSFVELQKLYPKEDVMLWKTLRVGIETILNEVPHQPAVYLFTHHGTEHVFKLIKEISEHSAGCFGKPMRPIEMKNEDFLADGIEDDFGYVVEKYKLKIKEGNVLLIANLNEIPAEAARALHYICDTHSPITKNVVIFLTLTISSKKEERSNDAKAEDALIELWGSKLASNELDPLITRVTDQVIFLKS